MLSIRYPTNPSIELRPTTSVLTMRTTYRERPPFLQKRELKATRATRDQRMFYDQASFSMLFIRNSVSRRIPMLTVDAELPFALLFTLTCLHKSTTRSLISLLFARPCIKLLRDVYGCTRAVIWPFWPALATSIQLGDKAGQRRQRNATLSSTGSLPML